MKKQQTICLSAPLLLLLAAGCAGPDMKKVRDAYTVGDFPTALAENGKGIADKTGDDSSGSALLWRLNHAAILAAAGGFGQAEPHWEIAQPVFERAWENDRVHILGDALGMVVPGTKDTTYYARPHEGLMFYTYRMLNALQLGDLDKAGRFLQAAAEFRNEVTEECEARVEKRKAKGLKSTPDLAQSAVSTGLDNDSRIQDSSLKDSSMDASAKLLDTVEQDRMREVREDLTGYANYANPLTGLLTYIFLHTEGNGLRITGGETANRELDALKVFAPKNSVVNGLDYSDNVFLSNTVFVFFETGLAPRQEEVKINVPNPILPSFAKGKTKTVFSYLPSYVGFAYPRLVANPNYVPQLSVSASGRRTATELLVNFDAITQQAFDDAWPRVIAYQIAQTIVNATANAAACWGLQQAIDKITDPYARIAAELAARASIAVLSWALIDADTRSWELLPKQVQVARLDIPENRTLALSFSGGWRQDITLGDGDVMAVWVKSTSPWQPAPVVSQFKFK